jgi:phage/plasmid-like protein (TIGR03299 family)
MAHEIEATDVFGEVRLHGQKAWHGLGVEINDGLRAWPAFQEIGLDWETELLPLVCQYKDTDGKKKQFKVPTHAAHIRKDTMGLLGVVGSKYKPVSNKALAEFADILVEADQTVVVETAGSLRNGRQIFALVRLPQDIAVTDQDILQQYVLVRNSHDGSAAFQIYPTSVRVVCANTLRLSEKDLSRGIQFQHTGDIKQKIGHARLALGLIMDEIKKFEAQVRVLAAKHVKQSEVAAYFRAVYDASFGVVPEVDETNPKDVRRFEKQIARRDGILETWGKNMDRDEQVMDGVRGTAWAAYNAVSFYHDHQRGRFLSVQESEGRVHSNLFGTSNDCKQAAFKEALVLAS